MKIDHKVNPFTVIKEDWYTARITDIKHNDMNPKKFSITFSITSMGNYYNQKVFLNINLDKDNIWKNISESIMDKLGAAIGLEVINDTEQFRNIELDIFIKNKEDKNGDIRSNPTRFAKLKTKSGTMINSANSHQQAHTEETNTSDNDIPF